MGKKKAGARGKKKLERPELDLASRVSPEERERIQAVCADLSAMHARACEIEQQLADLYREFDERGWDAGYLERSTDIDLVEHLEYASDLSSLTAHVELSKMSAPELAARRKARLADPAVARLTKEWEQITDSAPTRRKRKAPKGRRRRR